MKRAFIFVICLFLFACSLASTQLPTPVPTTQLISDGSRVPTSAVDLGLLHQIGMSQSDRTLVAVKVRFVLLDSSSQDMWVDGITHQDGSFHGTMGDDIPSLKLSIDDKITIPRKDIIDWMIVEDGKLIGGYTIRLAFQRMSPEQKERFLETVHYTIED